MTKNKITIEEIKSLNVEISAACKANCPFCSRHQKVRPYGDYLLTLKDFKRLPPEFIRQLKRISFSGNFGDLCCNPHTVDIARYIRRLNPTITLEGDTNGAFHSKTWWQQLGESFQKGCMVFCLDGLEDTHRLHRKGTNFHTILENLQAFCAGGGIAYWKFVVFEHNEHQIQKAEALARDIGCTRFFMVSSRDYDKTCRKPKTWAFQIKREMFFDHWKRLDPEERQAVCRPIDHRSLYIAADGTVHPCCFAHCMYITEHNESFRYIVPLVEKYYTEINIKTTPLGQIIEGPYFQAVFSKSRANAYCMIKCNKDKHSVKKKLVLYDRLFEPSSFNLG
jgi:MoaA/NifB/PqqE/SkfB family radical SAM enzyme